eukprot:2446202-Rhodomonas_salina.1
MGVVSAESERVWGGGRQCLTWRGSGRRTRTADTPSPRPSNEVSAHMKSKSAKVSQSQPKSAQVSPSQPKVSQKSGVLEAWSGHARHVNRG